MFGYDLSYDELLDYGTWAFIAFWAVPYTLAVPLSLLSLKKGPYQKWLIGISVILSPVVTGIIYLWSKKLKSYFKK